MQVVFLRGLGRDSKYWLDIPKVFESKGVKVLTPDLPGFGDAQGLESPLSIQKITNSVRYYLKHQLTNDPIYIIGISLGGMVGLDWADRFPSEISGLTVINTSAKCHAKPWERLSPFGMKQLVMSLFGSKEMSEKNILRLVSNLKHTDRDIINQLVDFRNSSELPLRSVLSQIFAASTYKAPKKLDSDTLFMVSENDRMVKSNCSERLAKTLKAKIVVHPEAGHDIPLDDPEWLTNEWFKHFYENHSA